MWDHLTAVRFQMFLYNGGCPVYATQHLGEKIIGTFGEELIISNKKN